MVDLHASDRLLSEHRRSVLGLLWLAYQHYAKLYGPGSPEAKTSLDTATPVATYFRVLLEGK